ncbi:MAG: cytochrome c oxidase subunit [Solirubrobacteraceae bacterium]|jgi:cytochrome c oxidase subunit 2|nr:cytochrome c oxidase subunit [Solirubrobacteraceae bacterium]
MVLGLVDTRKVFEDLASTYLPIAAAVFAVVVLVCLFSLVRFRARDDGSEPPGSQREEPPWLAIVYGGALACVVAFLVALTFNAQDKISARTVAPGLRITVTAAKWNWRFDYPGLGISQVAGATRPSLLVVPSATEIRFRMTSLDVIHSFWIPDLRFKRDAFPRRDTEFDLSFERPGAATSGLCAEFCGLKHDQMVFDIEVMTPADFQAWVARRRAAVPPGAAPKRTGR